MDDCPFCGAGTAAEPWRRQQACSSGPARDLLKCGYCGTIYPRPRLGAAQSMAELDALDKKERILEPAVSLTDPLCRLLKKRVPLGGKALDVGSATGGFCAALDSLGFEAHGLEPQASARALAEKRGTRTHAGLFPTLPTELSGAKFKLVSILEAIYYFPDLGKALKTAHDLLEPNGFLLVKGHHAESPVYADPARSPFKRFGDHAQGIPTAASLRFVLENSGFELVFLEGIAPVDSLWRRIRAKFSPWTAPMNADRLVALATKTR